MKKNDIFERTFDGNTLLFKLIILGPRIICIGVPDINLPCGRDIKSRIPPTFTDYVFANIEDGKYVTTKEGDDMIEKLAVEMYNRIKHWNSSIIWVKSNTSLKDNEVEDLVTKLYIALCSHYHDIYLPTIVKWACNGEINPVVETDIEHMCKLISLFHEHLLDRPEINAQIGYKIDFDDNGFKRVNSDGVEIRLENMKDTKNAIRSWFNEYNKHENLFEKYASDGDSLDAWKALHLLMRVYIRECETNNQEMRVLIHNAGEIWFCERLLNLPVEPSRDQHYLRKVAELIPLIGGKYDPPFHWQYQGDPVYDCESLKRFCLKAVSDRTYDDFTLQALCWSIKNMPKTKNKTT